MGASDRNIQHLRLRAPSAQMAVHAAHRLEDALRCASLPDTGERLLLVRRLHLGRLPAGCSSQSLSLLIEQRVGAVGGEWVRGDDEARAARSDTVFFASRLQAAQIALRRRAMGLPLDGWHWPLALPGVAVHAHAQAFLAQLVECLGAQPEAPALLPVLAIHALEHGHARWLMQHVDAALARRWVELAGAQRFMPATVSWAGGGSDVPSGGDAGNPVEPLETRQTPDVPAWLSALLRADAVWGGAGAVGASRLSPIAVSSPSLTRAQARVSASARPDRTRTRASMRSAVPAGQRVDGSLSAGNGTRAVINEVMPRSPGKDGSAATQAGGLWFLLPMLERLGFADWQTSHAERPVLALILRQALRCLRVAHDDPAWAWVDSLPCDTDLAPRRWNLPGCWATPTVHLRHAPRVALTVQAMARCWLIAVRRQLRHDANLSLADVCRRTARLRWSRTHVDVVFAKNAADVRVRRLGLDIDPGWIAWLGRVVLFVYGSPEGEDT
ncbi:hypothetical protein [Hydrogenophaga sp.]|uniref:hypothetical protein n=1 Tax=Hydrogenophaga sp. TaxID=1904254 RepID=UPI00272F2AAA|nr:hypothetical protein [Hydrogenophaga sp.]MDP2075921.1 hypothetical protein [Hydrogenophaga sp.]MDP3109283.1 hypothetical protein [Hydrogenophaga sp.]